ncbi:MAG: cytochrome c biogenesis protein CcdA [Actinomycetota bacterium]
MIADIVQTGLSSWWAPALAFLAGLVSFASPCVFPLVPGYISFVSGERAVDHETRRPLVPILLFIAGFTIVFTLLGAFAQRFVPIFKGDAGQRIGGVVVVAIGVFMIAYALRRGSIALYAERRPFLAKVRPGAVGALPLGMAFAAGWTPCLGPVLTGILAIAATQSSLRGVLLLVAYSFGLGVPFLLVGLGVQRFVGAFGWVKRHYRWIAGVSGALLVVVGVLLMTGLFTRIVAPLSRFAPGL